VYIRTTVDPDQGNAVKKHNYTSICMYNNVPTTCFGLFLNDHHQVGWWWPVRKRPKHV